MRSTIARSSALAIGVAAVLVATLGAAPALDDTVLTVDGPGGTAVAVGDTLTAGLTEGSAATFYDSEGGTTGVSCATSGFTGTVDSNPAAPGTATGSLSGLELGDCTASIFGVSGVEITVENLPYTLAVSSDPGNPVTISGETMQITADLDTLLGPISCVYQATGISGSADNADNSITFTAQQFTRSAGPDACFSPGYFTATYAPVQNATQGDAPVFVN